MNKKITISTAIILVLLFISYNVYKSSITYSIKQIYRAYSLNDYVLLTKYVDIENIVNSLLNQFNEFEKKSDQKNQENNFVVNSMINLLIESHKSKLKNSLINYLKTGNIIESEEMGLKVEDIIDQLYYYNQVQYELINDDKAVVGMEFLSKNKSHSSILDISLIDMGDYWRIVEMKLPKSLVSIILERVQERNSRFALENARESLEKAKESLIASEKKLNESLSNHLLAGLNENEVFNPFESKTIIIRELGTTKYALFENVIVSQGDSIGEYYVKNISLDSIIIIKDDLEYILKPN